jgi:hypothetical protein
MSEQLSCAEVTELLDAVAAYELAGANVQERYAEVLAHFRRCGRCRAAYLMLLDALRCQQETASLYSAALSPPSLALLDGDRESPWRRLGGTAASPLPLTFEIAHAFIDRAMSGPRLTGVRGEPTAFGERQALLLADWVAAGGGDWVVEVTAHQRASHPQTIDVEARLVTDDPLPVGLRASLLWGAQSRSVPLDPAGVAHFRGLRLSQLVRSESGRIEDDLIVRFDVEDANQRDGG